MRNKALLLEKGAKIQWDFLEKVLHFITEGEIAGFISTCKRPFFVSHDRIYTQYTQSITGEKGSMTHPNIKYHKEDAEITER